MEKSGLLGKGDGKGIDFIDPIKLQKYAGKKKYPNIFILKKTTTVSIDNIPANTPKGTIVVNPDGSTSWVISGAVSAKEVIDVSGGVLPSANVIADDIYLIGVGGTVSTIGLVSGNKIQAKIDNPSDSQTGGIFDDWILIKPPPFSSTTVDRPNGDSVEDSLVDLQNQKVDIVAGKQLSTEDYTTGEKNKLAGIEENAEVNVNADWNSTSGDSEILNKPTLGTTSDKDVGNQAGEIQENGATLGSSEIVETDATGKIITASKNTAYNKNFGTTNGDVARGDASYLKSATYTKSEIDNVVTATSVNDRARANHTGEQAITTITGLQNALDAKEATTNKGVANGYASLDGNAKVPVSQIPANMQSFKIVADLTARNAIPMAERSEGLPVHVVDASAYADVGSGSAGYILQGGLANSNFVKIYESESLDIDLSLYFNKTTDTTNDITDSTDKRYITDAQQTVLTNTSGINTGDETTATIQAKRPLKTIEGQIIEGSGNIDLTSTDVGLSNVDNTSDADKPVSTAQQTALDGKLAKASNLSDLANRQTSLDNLTDVSNATNEHVLTKDTATGLVLFKAPSGGGGGSDFEVGDYTHSARSTKSGWLLCNGQAVSRTTYANLFSVINTSFGVGDNSTTFNLPDPRGRALGYIGQGNGLTNRSLGDKVGQETHTLTASESGVPAHSHTITGNALDNNSTTNPNAGTNGAISYVRDSDGSTYGDGSFDGMKYFADNQTSLHFASDVDWINKQNATLSASNNSATNASNAHNNMQPTLFAGNLFIKF